MATLPPPPALIDSRPTDEASKKRKTSSSAEGESCGSKEKKKRDLEVRKDLTLPTAPTAGVDNVFQVRFVFRWSKSGKLNFTLIVKLSTAYFFLS